jgi:hypothetical protein
VALHQITKKAVVVNTCSGCFLGQTVKTAKKAGCKSEKNTSEVLNTRTNSAELFEKQDCFTGKRRFLPLCNLHKNGEKETAKIGRKAN